MKRFRQILVYLAGTGPESVALQRASRLARTTGARVLAVQVVPEEARKLGTAPLAQIEAAYRELALESAASLRDIGITAEHRLLHGKPFVELIREVQRSNVDLVIKDAQGRGPSTGGLFGSTALHLLRKAPCPIWVVKPEERQRYEHILAAVDPSPDDPNAADLAVDILRLASSIAHSEAATLEVVHAWWIEAEKTLRGRRANLPVEQIEEMIQTVEDRAKSNLSELLERAALDRTINATTLIKGPPFEVIGDRANKADLVVMGTISRTGVPGMLIGNTAERVLQRIDTSLVTVKPAGFVSPVQTL